MKTLLLLACSTLSLGVLAEIPAAQEQDQNSALDYSLTQELTKDIPAPKKSIDDHQHPKIKVPPIVDYPKSAIDHNEQGETLVSLSIDEAGNVADIRILKSSGFKDLDDAVVAGFKKTQFEPFLDPITQKPSRATTKMSSVFKLDDTPYYIPRLPADLKRPS